MPRPPLPVGTAGTFGFTTMPNGHTRARAQFRDYDGTTRPVTRYGPSKAAAERRLKEAIRDRRGPAGDGRVTAETRVSALVDIWLSEVADSDLAGGSKDLYERTAKNRVVPALGGLRVMEVDVPAVDRWLKAVRRNHGASAARTSKNVASGLFGLAVRHGAISVNPVTGTANIPSGERKQPRALTAVEQVKLIEKVAADEVAVEQDIVDLVKFMNGTGVRIGEALGVRRDVVDVEAGVIEIDAKSTWRKGEGAVLEHRTKSDAGWRVIAVPGHVIDLCTHRMGMTWPNNEVGLLFPTVLGEVRLPTNAARVMRQVFDRAGFEWVTSHTFRKTVVTRLDEAGLSAREIADHVGHAQPSMTQNVYMGRGVASATAAKVLGE